jgi:putative transposase
MAADFLVVPTLTYRLLFVLVILAHDRRRNAHVPSPTIPLRTGRHTSFGMRFRTTGAAVPPARRRCRFHRSTIAAMQIEEVVTAPRSPGQNAYLERFIGSIRRECLDHVIVLSRAGLQSVPAEYVAYYMTARTHLSLGRTLRSHHSRRPRPRDVSSRFPRLTGCTAARAHCGIGHGSKVSVLTSRSGRTSVAGHPSDTGGCPMFSTIR